MFEKIKDKKFLKLTSFIISILIIIQLYSFIPSIKNRYPNLFDRKSILNMLQQAKIDEFNLQQRYQITAIVLHWKRLTQIQHSIKNYLYSQLFKAVIIWNNNPQMNLTLNDLVINNTSSIDIQIINSKVNYKDQAKYFACTKAKTNVCFYADDDWDVAHYMKSLIASFYTDPYLLHSATDNLTYYNNLLWSFMDSRINLHAGFSWIGSGSLFLREHAQRHLQLLKIHLIDNSDLLAYSDIFFAVWCNDIPTQMIVDLRSLPADPTRIDEPLTEEEDFGDFLLRSAILASETLYYDLLNSNNSSTYSSFSRQQKRRFPYTTRSPSLNDDFIFFSNILPLEIEHIPFNITVDADRATYKTQPNVSSYQHFTIHNTLKAVDNNETTCWSHLNRVKKGDYFAIDFLRIQNNIIFSITIGHSLNLQKTLDVRISFDGISWISHQSINGIFSYINIISTNMKLHRLVINSSEFSAEFQSFRYITFNASQTFNESFQVCDVQLLKKYN